MPAAGQLGDQLEKRAQEATKGLGYRLTFVPWVRREPGACLPPRLPVCRLPGCLLWMPAPGPLTVLQRGSCCAAPCCRVRLEEIACHFAGVHVPRAQYSCTSCLCSPPTTAAPSFSCTLQILVNGIPLGRDFETLPRYVCAALPGDRCGGCRPCS